MKRVLLSLVIHCYGAAVDAATAFLVPVLLPLGKKHGWHLAERRRLPRIVRGHRCRTVVWVHAASLGEAKLLLQPLRRDRLDAWVDDGKKQRRFHSCGFGFEFSDSGEEVFLFNFEAHGREPEEKRRCLPIKKRWQKLLVAVI